MDADRLLDFSTAAAPEGASPWLPGFGPTSDLTVVDHQARWRDDFESLAAAITGALSDTAMEIDHVGSTAVPGLAAKPVIDVVVVVADPDDESAYVPGLTAAGFVHAVREPWWFGHRLLRHEGPRANIHVFGPDCPEVARMRIFRDWLRTHPDDVDAYRRVKLAAAAQGGHMMDYNARKQRVLREIVTRAVMSAG